MPPKFGLALAIPVEEPPASTNMASIRMSDDALTVLTSSYNPISFTTEGMKKNGEIVINIAEKDIKTLRKLGQGASGIVHKGFFIRENKFVAVKKINVFERETRHQMLNDLKALIGAGSIPGLVNFYGAYHVPESGQISIVLEYVDGGSLADVLAKVGKIPERALSKITASILQTLLHLHRDKHMVHRDIKPANILMSLKGEPKVTDFGISAFITSTLAQCNTFLGTVTYMSPERINNESYSFPADIWSLGLTLIELATGRYPYDANDGPLQLMIHVLHEELPLPPAGEFSEDFRDFIRLCLQKNPRDRPPADQLLTHAFIRRYASDTVDLKAIMEPLANPHDKLDEIAIVFAYNYYQLLNQGVQRLQDLAPLYADNSVLTYDGETAKGRAAIIAKLQGVAQMHAGFKIMHTVKDVTCTPLGFDGSALVTVVGVLMSPLAPQPFEEVFILSQMKAAEYYVANQIFRLRA